MSSPSRPDPLTRAFLISGLIFFAAILLTYGSGVLVPLAIALLIWFLINAVAGGFQRLSIAGHAIPWAPALILSLTTILIAGFMVVDLVVSNLSVMSTQTIDFGSSLDPLIDKIADFAGISNKQVLNQIFDKIGLESLFGRIVSGMTGFASQLGVILVYVMFLLIEQQFFDAKLNALVKDDAKRDRVHGVLERISDNVQSYMSIMTLVSALTAVFSYLVMRWIGLEHAGFWAFLIFALNFIPTIGSVIGTALPALFALLQFQNFTEPLILLAAIGVIQFVIGNILQPRLAGRTLNMSQFVVILSLFVWGAMWGVTGMFLGVPMTAIILIVLSNFETTRPVAILMSQEGRIDSRADIS